LGSLSNIWTRDRKIQVVVGRKVTKKKGFSGGGGPPTPPPPPPKKGERFRVEVLTGGVWKVPQTAAGGRRRAKKYQTLPARDEEKG